MFNQEQLAAIAAAMSVLRSQLQEQHGHQQQHQALLNNNNHHYHQQASQQQPVQPQPPISPTSPQTSLAAAVAAADPMHLDFQTSATLKLLQQQQQHYHHHQQPTQPTQSQQHHDHLQQQLQSLDPLDHYQNNHHHQNQQQQQLELHSIGPTFPSTSKLLLQQQQQQQQHQTLLNNHHNYYQTSQQSQPPPTVQPPQPVSQLPLTQLSPQAQPLNSHQNQQQHYQQQIQQQQHLLQQQLLTNNNNNNINHINNNNINNSTIINNNNVRVNNNNNVKPVSYSAVVAKSAGITSNNVANSQGSATNLLGFMGLYVGNLSPELTKEQLEKIFSKYGEPVKAHRLIRSPVAFIKYENTESPRAAIDDLHGLLLPELTLNQDQPLKLHFDRNDAQLKANYRPTDLPPKGDNGECYAWRTTICRQGKLCPKKHIPINRGIDFQMWMIKSTPSSTP